MRILKLFFISVLPFAVLSSNAQTKFAYQNPDLPVEERVEDLISRMTLQEKVSQLFNEAPAIERLGIPAYNWWNECLHGVARSGKATVFPQAIGMAATFDESLMFRIATAISDEARAKHHNFVRNNVRSIYTGLTFWTPNINIFRDPRWGRGQETYGEDPFLTGRMAVNFIKGLQGNDAKYLKTIATAKHYAVHSGPEFTRHSDNIFINDRDLYETYLPAFRATVKEANVQSVMCAYNRFRDQPCCGSDLLMSNILRNEFGFKGYVVSDCGAITDFYRKESHGIVETPSQAWGWSLASGTDLNCEMSKDFLQNIDAAVKNGVINEKDINTSLGRLFKARFMLGMFDPQDKIPFTKIPMTVVGSETHLKLSQEAAEKSLVLLKNNGILPLKNIKKVALIGPNADNFSILIGNYNGEPIKPITPLTALRAKLGANNVMYAPGGPIVPGVFTNYETVPAKNLFHLEKGKLEKGLKAEYFKGKNFEGAVVINRVDPNVKFYWEKSPLSSAFEEDFCVHWSGVLIPDKTASYQFRMSGGGAAEIKIDNQTIADNTDIKLEKGKRYSLDARVTFASFWWANTIEASANFAWVESSRDYRQEALNAARNSDVVIFCGGISANLEGEEMKLETDGFAHGDRTHINLPSIQEDLLKELFKTGKPIVYVNFSGSAIALNWQAENLPAIVQGFYPGETTGTALTRLLFGEINPSGRLPVTFYKTIDDLPEFLNYKMEGRTYRYFKGEPLFPFGFGLSYTKFSYANLELPKALEPGKDVKVAVEITNSGSMDGEEVAQLYVSNTDASVPVPLRSLAAYQRVFLKKGETKKLEFVLKADKFSILDNNLNHVVAPGKFSIAVGGIQPDGKQVKSENVVYGDLQFSGSVYKIQDY
jgi:beta-glucosidase